MRKLFIVIMMLPLTIDAKGEDKNAKNVEASEKKIAAQPHEGVWQAVAAVLGGSKLSEEEVKAITLIINGDNYQVLIANEQPDMGICKADATKTPKRMTIKGTEGPNKGKTYLAIFEMKDADSLRVCYDLSGKEFPRQFAAPRDTLLFVVEYRRQIEKTTEKPAKSN